MDVKKIEDKAIDFITIALSILTLVGAVTVGLQAVKDYIMKNRQSKPDQSRTFNDSENENS